MWIDGLSAALGGWWQKSGAEGTIKYQRRQAIDRAIMGIW
jgi:hypothetical protein